MWEVCYWYWDANGFSTIISPFEQMDSAMRACVCVCVIACAAVSENALSWTYRSERLPWICNYIRFCLCHWGSLWKQKLHNETFILGQPKKKASITLQNTACYRDGSTVFGVNHSFYELWVCAVCMKAAIKHLVKDSTVAILDSGLKLLLLRVRI